MRNWLLCSWALMVVPATAQHWRAIGRGTIGPTSVTTLYGDSVSDRLLAGGSFLYIRNAEDTVLGLGQAAWNGARWDSLAHRIQPIAGTGAMPTHWFLRFENELYACGHFPFEVSEGVWNNSLARLNELTQRWEALECINPDVGGMATWSPRIPQSNLYATGHVGSLCGYPESCVFRYDGSAFAPWEPFQDIPADSDNLVGYVFEFLGKTYMTGFFRDPYTENIISLMRHNGTSWEYVPGWSTSRIIKTIAIRNDTLFAGGEFTIAEGAPGDLVAAFDGEAWHDMGGGLLYEPVPMSSVVYDLEWFQGELYACGLFTRAGDVYSEGIAKWNGRQWCVPPGTFEGFVNGVVTFTDLTVWRDSLYVCGGFHEIDGQPAGQVAQWIGGDAVAACSTPLSLPERTAPAANLYPLPGTNGFELRLHQRGPVHVQVMDATGRMVHAERLQGDHGWIGTTGWPPGHYTVLVRWPNGQQRALRWIRE